MRRPRDLRGHLESESFVSSRLKQLSGPAQDLFIDLEVPSPNHQRVVTLSHQSG